MHPILFQSQPLRLFFGEPFVLHTYGVLIALGFLLGMHLARRQGEEEGEDPEQVVDITFYLLLFGMLGARIVYILTQLPSMLAHPIEIVMIWRGGLVWYGGFLGAIATLWLYCRRHALSPAKYVDLLIGPMALAHAFGRLGCLFAGCCYGHITRSPVGIVFPPFSMAQAAHHAQGLVGATSNSMPVHPTQLYEAGGELLLFWLIAYLRPRKRFDGQLFLVWLSFYPIMRGIIEMFRGDKERGMWWALSTSQYISIAVGLCAIVLTVIARAATRAERQA